MRLVSHCVYALAIAALLALPGSGAPASASQEVAQQSNSAETATTAATVRASDPLRLFLTRPPEGVTSYRALRTLRASNKRFKKDGWLTAWTELDPRGGFRYDVIAEGGSDYIRRRVLRKMLDGERDAMAQNQSSRVALSTVNYQFVLESDDGQIARVRMMPLREETLLVQGTMRIEAATGDLLGVEGRLAKNPSFWTNRVDVMRRYGRVAGIRVPLHVTSTANVKIAGTSEFSMTYEYESINETIVGRPEVTVTAAR